jgi:hypothetical protein
LFVGGDTSLNGNLYVTKQLVNAFDVSMNTRLFVGGDASFNRNLYVTFDTSIN